MSRRPGSNRKARRQGAVRQEIDVCVCGLPATHSLTTEEGELRLCEADYRSVVEYREESDETRKAGS